MNNQQNRFYNRSLALLVDLLVLLVGWLALTFGAAKSTKDPAMFYML